MNHEHVWLPASLYLAPAYYICTCGTLSRKIVSQGEANVFKGDIGTYHIFSKESTDRILKSMEEDRRLELESYKLRLEMDKKTFDVSERE